MAEAEQTARNDLLPEGDDDAMPEKAQNPKKEAKQKKAPQQKKPVLREVRRQSTRESHRENQWYRLDNAAKIYPAITDKNRSSVFRVAVQLTEEVDKELLDAALRVTLPRFPAFAVRMRKGLFWYYFDPNDTVPESEVERAPVCRAINPNETKGYLIRVICYKKRIGIEVFHAITDGSGALAFLKTLTFQYLRLRGCDIRLDDSILHCDEFPSVFEYEDSFGIHYDSAAKGSWAEEKAYQMIGTRKPAGIVSVTHGTMSAAQLKSVAKAANSTITEYLTAALMYAIYCTRLMGRGSALPVKISVPVNLRKFYSSRTLRNFSSYVNVSMSFSRIACSFEQILCTVSEQMKNDTQLDRLLRKISVNVNAERNILMRIAPLLLKNIVLRTAGNLYGDKLITTTLSNLGVVDVPEQMRQYIDRFEFLLGAPSINMFNSTACTFGDKLVLSFTRVMEETDVEKFFFRFLASKGVDIVIDTN